MQPQTDADARPDDGQEVVSGTWPDAAPPLPLVPPSGAGQAAYSITVRLGVVADAAAIGRVTTAAGAAGATVTALDVADSTPTLLTVDLTCLVRDPEHAQAITVALQGLPGVAVRNVSDRTFLLHLGGKIEVTSKVPLRTRDDLSMAYTPGVARVCLALAAAPQDARALTIKRNSVAVVTDGSAVLGLGDLGPYAALPVMEGKAALFKRFADVDAWPICLDTHDVDEIVRTVQLIAPGFGGINLEDISAPRCFEVERRLQDSLDIPVFHDDQHGTAIVVLAALLNALVVVGKELAAVRIVVCGAGAAGSAITRLLLHSGATHLVLCDVGGVVHSGRGDLDANRADLAASTRRTTARSLSEALVGADVFIGVSTAGVLTESDVASMAGGAIVFALANPVPEIDPALARRHAAVVATGRSDEPNQINNVLVFPGVFRGLLDSGAHRLTLAAERAAAQALAGVLVPGQLNAAHIIPSVFDPAVAPAVAAAVARTATHAAPAAPASREPASESPRRSGSTQADPS